MHLTLLCTLVISKLQGIKQLQLVLKSLKVNFVCSVQKSKHKGTILISDYCRALDWWFAYCLSAPKPPFCDLLCDAGAEILWMALPRLPWVHLLLGSPMEAGGREKVSILFSSSNSHQSSLRLFWHSQHLRRPTPAVGWSGGRPWGPRSWWSPSPLFCSPRPRDGSCFQRLLTLGLLQHFLSALLDFKLV